MPETIAIRNPRVLEVVDEEIEHGAGRNATEAAENLILAAAETRRVDRARTPRRRSIETQDSGSKR